MGWLQILSYKGKYINIELYLRLFSLATALSLIGDLSFSFFWNVKFLLLYPVFGLSGIGIITILGSLSGLFILEKFLKSFNILNIYYKVNIVKVISILITTIFIRYLTPPYNYFIAFPAYMIISIGNVIIAGTINSVFSFALSDKDKFTQFTAFLGTATRIALIFGWSIAGIIAKIGGETGLFLFDFITFIPLIVIAFLLEKSIPNVNELMKYASKEKKKGIASRTKRHLGLIMEISLVFIVGSLTTMTTVILWKENNPGQMSDISLGLFFGSFSAGMVLSSILLMEKKLSKIFTDHILKFKKITLLLTSFFCLLTVIFSKNFITFLIVLFAYGLFGGFIVPSYTVAINNFFKEEKYIIFNYFGIVSNYSGSIANIISAIIISLFSIHFVYFFSSLGLLLCLLLTVFTKEKNILSKELD